MSPLYPKLLWAASFLGRAFRADPIESIACKRIDSEIPNRVSYPASSAYIAAQSQYYSGQESELRPACIFSPQNTSEVSHFIKLMTVDAEGTRLSSFSPQFAIRGGGHSVWSGAANIDGGITIDMRAMNSVVLSDDQKVASIGAGGIWSVIYPQIEPYNLTVAGGRVAGVGLGGFLTGGGISYLSRRHGWACDSVYGYEVVLASGETVYATADLHRDLWLALKGGSNNFGIVTRFDVATYPIKNMWGGTLMFEYNKSLLEAQAKAFSNFMDPKNFDDAASMFVALFYINGIWVAANVLFYIEPVANPPAFQEFTSISSPLSSTLRLTKVSDVATEQPSTLSLEANRAIDIVVSFKNPSATVYSELFQAWEDGTKSLAEIAGLQLSLLIQPHPVSNGTNSLGLSPGGDDLVMSVITVAYSNKADDAVVQKGMESIIEKHTEILSREGAYIPFQYLNYADKASQDPIGSYGQVVKARLQAASTKYDPHGLFQTGVPSGFKLFDSKDTGTTEDLPEKDEL